MKLIVATENNNGIGLDNTIPWYIPEDLKYFKKITTETKSPDLQNAVILGRKTWDSLPDKFKPLPNRLNIVLTQNKEFKIENKNCLVLNSFDSLLANLDTIQREHKIESFIIIGGLQIYQWALSNKLCDTCFITKVNESFKCDVHFPKLPNEFKLTNSSEVHTHNKLAYQFLTFNVTA